MYLNLIFAPKMVDLWIFLFSAFLRASKTVNQDQEGSNFGFLSVKQRDIKLESVIESV